MNSSLRTQLLLALFLCLSAFRTDTVSAQFRVVPERSKGGANYAPYAEPWTDIPDAFRDFKIPAWPVPTDLSKWKTTGRNEVRQVLLHCLGEMPTRPDPKQVRIISREEKEFFVLERFEFFNGVDMTVPGILVLPKHSTGKVSVVLGLHGHTAGQSTTICPTQRTRYRLGGCWYRTVTLWLRSTAISMAIASGKARADLAMLQPPRS